MEALDAGHTGGVEEGHVPKHVRAEEARRIDDGEAVVRLGREVHDDFDPLVAERALGVAVADVALHEHDPVVDRGEVRPVAGIREQVEDDDVVVRVPLEPVVHEVRADEAGPAGDEQPHDAEG